MEKYVAIVNELKQKAAEHAAALKAWANDLEEAKKNIKNAKEARAKAADNGNAAGYREAVADETYWTERAEALEKKIVKPALSYDGVAAYNNRLRAAEREAISPLYAELLEAENKMREVMTKIQDFAQYSNGIRYISKAAYPGVYKNANGGKIFIDFSTYSIPYFFKPLQEVLFKDSQHRDLLIKYAGNNK